MSGLIEIKQEGMIDCPIETLGLNVVAVNGEATPVKAKKGCR